MTDIDKRINMNPRHYWGIKHGDTVLHTGTFEQCWNEFVRLYSLSTLKQIEADNIRIARVK